MFRTVSRCLVVLTVAMSTIQVQAAGISFSGGVVMIVGTNANDQATVRYVSGKGGRFSRSPTDVVEVRLLNLGLTEYYPTASVQMIRFGGLGRDDFFHNQTWIDSDANGNGGNDLLIGGHGSDNLEGNDGDDELIGGMGNDVLDGGDHDDLMSGGPGFDFMIGGEGDDILSGGTEDDSCFGNGGKDLIVAGAGDDIAHGGDGPDMIDGNEGRDIVIGGASRDDLTGGAGDDIMVGADVLFPLVHESLNFVWLEWTSTHTFGIRARNVLGFPHPTFHERFNANEFLICGVTVSDDGALDEIDAVDGGQDLLLIDTYDDVSVDLIDISTCL